MRLISVSIQPKHSAESTVISKLNQMKFLKRKLTFFVIIFIWKEFLIVIKIRDLLELCFTWLLEWVWNNLNCKFCNFFHDVGNLLADSLTGFCRNSLCQLSRGLSTSEKLNRNGITWVCTTWNIADCATYATRNPIEGHSLYAYCIFLVNKDGKLSYFITKSTRIRISSTLHSDQIEKKCK